MDFEGREIVGRYGSSPEDQRAAHTAQMRERYKTDPVVLNRIKSWQKRNPDKMARYKMLISARQRAAKFGLPFNITLKDIVIPAVCPILGIPIRKGTGVADDSSPTLDRLRPELGYVRGNVEVISRRANTIKSFGTAEEHRLVAAFIESRVSNGADT